VQPMRWNRQLLPLSLMGVLSLPMGWVAWNAIAPPPVQAYVSRADVVLDVQAGEGYQPFISRAETVARAAIQRSFDRDILISEVYVVIVGQRQGQSAPVLSVQVSRNQWRGRPDPRRWATYFPTARILLGFDIKPTVPTQTSPAATTPAPTVTQPASPVPNTTPSPTPTPPINTPNSQPANRTPQNPTPLPTQGTGGTTTPPGSTPLPPVRSPR